MAKIGSMSIFAKGIKMPSLWNGNTVFNVEEVAISDRSGEMTKSYKVDLFQFESACAVGEGHELLAMFGIPFSFSAKSTEEAEIIAGQLYKKFTAILDLIKQKYTEFK